MVTRWVQLDSLQQVNKRQLEASRHLALKMDLYLSAFTFRHDDPDEAPAIQKFVGPFPDNGTSDAEPPFKS